jgi:predicted peptidase
MATGGDAEDAARVKNLPIWYFIGSKDGDVPERAHKMVEALKKVGANLRFTEYPDAGHVETWTKAYDDPQFYQWLLQQRRR